MLSIKNLAFTYKSSSLFHERARQLFEGFGFEFAQPGVCGLLGPNGSGKTTLLKLICGMRFPDAGSCEVDGRASAKRELRTLRQIFFVPEQFSLPGCSAAEYLQRYASFYPQFSQARIHTFLEAAGFSKDDNLGSLSTGQQRQFLLAFAFAANCPLLLLDEPANGLDIHAREWLRAMLVQEGAERFIIVSAHQMEEFRNILDRVLIINQGCIALDMATADIPDNFEFGIDSIVPPDALYSERAIGGYAWVRRTRSNDGETDLELLYKALVRKEAAR